MYRYTDFDEDFVRNRVAQFRSQVQDRLDGVLTEDEFRPLRLMNGLYLQLHAYMLRIAIPYGTLDSRQMEQLAMIAETYDRGYGHFTTRQNIQFNWPRLKDVPDILAHLADVDMHAIQTSGNCIRNVTADHFAGAAHDEIEDPRPIAELLRQWSTDHPEFQFMPRKFKIAVSGAPHDRAVIRAHDIGIEIVRNAHGEIGYKIFVGGGLGRTPMIGKSIRNFVSKADILPYLEAVVHIWNRFGRRDNKFKARIKILIHEYGLENFSRDVEAVFPSIKREFDGTHLLTLTQIEQNFLPPQPTKYALEDFDKIYANDPAFRSFVDTNTTPHRFADYAILTISTKSVGATPGDVRADQMRVIARLARTYAHNEMRISHEQNIILPHVHKAHLPFIYEELCAVDLATDNIGLISDIIACPGMDYCALATARSIPVAQEIAKHFHARGLAHEIGLLKIKISGCINACGHHHVGHIGILGLDRAGVENYQIVLGGDGTENMHIGEHLGPGLGPDDLIPALDRLINAYLELRKNQGESFLETWRRLGMTPFKSAVYQET